MNLAEIGVLLRETRERKSVSLDEIQAATKIRYKYLVALESGEESAFPGTVYLKGFLRTYANELGLDGWQLVEEYNRYLAENGPTSSDYTGGQPGPVARAPSQRRQVQTSYAPAVPAAPAVSQVGAPAGGMVNTSAEHPRRAVPRSRLWVYVILTLAIAALAAYGYSYLGRAVGLEAPPAGAADNNPPAGGPTPPAGTSTGPGSVTSPAGAGTPQAPVTLLGVDGSGTNETARYAVSQSNIALTVRAAGRCWFHVEADGKVVFEGTLTAGQSMTWTAARELFLRAGDPGVVAIQVNGVDIGPVGQAGIPRNLLFIIK